MFDELMDELDKLKKLKDTFRKFDLSWMTEGLCSVFDELKDNLDKFDR